MSDELDTALIVGDRGGPWLSSIVTTEGIVHYEMDGRGEPVVLLHGWINSWDVWRETMIHIAEQHRFKVYALDFWGFGESANEKDASPSSWIPMSRWSTSLWRSWASNALRSSVTRWEARSRSRWRWSIQTRVSKAAVVGSPIVGRLAQFVAQAGRAAVDCQHAVSLPWDAAPGGLVCPGWRLEAGQEMIFRDVSRTSAESFFRSIGTCIVPTCARVWARSACRRWAFLASTTTLCIPSQARS